MDDSGLFEEATRFITQESILDLFDKVDAAMSVPSPIEVFVVRYSAIVLARKNNRGSNDVDIIPSRFSRAFAEHGLEVFDEWNRYWFNGNPELVANYSEVIRDGSAIDHT